jgi:hypothetical protein
MTARRYTSFALALFLAAPSVFAQQQPTPAAIAEARDRFNRGVALSQEHNYNAAMAEFQRAYELTHNPAVLFNISATHEFSGHYGEALDAMLDYERQAPAETVAQRRTEIDAALARLRGRVGTVVVRFEADGLEIRIDGLLRATSEARRGLRVSTGRHRIALSAQHFVPREEEVDVSGGSTLVLSEPLAPERAFMAVECNVTGAEIVVDGHTVAMTPTTSPLPVPEGSHHVMVRRVGFTTYETDVNSVGAGARVRAQLAWADPMPRDVAAHITVHANELDTVTYLGDRRVPADGNDLVPPGQHHLRVERTDFLPEERDIDLSAGRNNDISVFLQPTPSYRENYFSGRRRSLVTGAVLTGIGLLVTGAGAAGYFYFNGDYTDIDTRITDIRRRLNNSPTRMDVTQTGCDLVLGDAFQSLEACANGLQQADLYNANILRWTSVGVAGAGLITAIVGIVVMAGAPSGSRFDRPTSWVHHVRVTGGLRDVGLSFSF